MSRTWVVSVLVVVALIIPTMTFSQAVPIGAWCGGSYGAEGTNFGPCPTVQSGAQVAGPASGIQAQRGPTEPQYPASQVASSRASASRSRSATAVSARAATS